MILIAYDCSICDSFQRAFSTTTRFAATAVAVYATCRYKLQTENVRCKSVIIVSVWIERITPCFSFIRSTHTIRPHWTTVCVCVCHHHSKCSVSSDHEQNEHYFMRTESVVSCYLWNAGSADNNIAPPHCESVGGMLCQQEHDYANFWTASVSNKNMNILYTIRQLVMRCDRKTSPRTLPYPPSPSSASPFVCTGEREWKNSNKFVQKPHKLFGWCTSVHDGHFDIKCLGTRCGVRAWASGVKWIFIQIQQYVLSMLCRRLVFAIFTLNFQIFTTSTMAYSRSSHCRSDVRCHHNRFTIWQHTHQI